MPIAKTDMPAPSAFVVPRKIDSDARDEVAPSASAKSSHSCTVKNGSSDTLPSEAAMVFRIGVCCANSRKRVVESRRRASTNVASCRLSDKRSKGLRPKAILEERSMGCMGLASVLSSVEIGAEAKPGVQVDLRIPRSMQDFGPPDVLLGVPRRQWWPGPHRSRKSRRRTHFRVAVPPRWLSAVESRHIARATAR